MRIPTYERQVDIQPSGKPYADPNALTADTRAMVNFGEQAGILAATGLRIERHNEKILQAAALEITKRENKFAALDAFGKANIEKEQLYETTAASLDGVNNAEKLAELNKGLREIDQKHTVNANPYFMDHYIPLAQAHNVQFSSAFSKKAAVVLAAKEVAQVTTLSDDVIRKADFMNVGQSIGTIDQIIDLSGIPPQEKDKLKREKQFQLMDTVTRQSINDPVIGPAFVKAMQNEGNFNAWMEKANPAMKDEYKKLINTAVSQGIETTKYGEILNASKRPDGSIDFDSAIVKTYDPANGLKPEQQRSIALNFENLKKQELLKDENYSSTQGISLINAYVGKSLKYSDIQIASEGIADPQKREKFLKDWTVFLDKAVREDRAELAAGRAMTNQERTIKQQEKKDKSDSIEGEIIVQQLQNPDEPLTQEYITQKIIDGLDPVKGAKYMEKDIKRQQDMKRYRLGVDVIEKAFRLGVLDAPSRGRMLTDFFERVKEEKATGKRVIDIADEMVNPKKSNFVQEMLGNIWNKVKAPGVDAKHVTIDGKQFRDGDTVTKDGKQYKVRVQ